MVNKLCLRCEKERDLKYAYQTAPFRRYKVTLKRLPMCADLINQNYTDYSLLDIGCRTMALRPYLKNCKEYCGTDLMPAEGVIQCNLEEGLPQIKDNAYDIVVALDVLEHLENAHLVLKEMIRVARKAVFVSLPNMHYITFRKNFLLGKGISGKYGLPVDPILDRHRWVLSFDEAKAFVEQNAKPYKAETFRIMPARGRTKHVSVPVESFLADIWPNLFIYGSLTMIKKEQ